MIKDTIPIKKRNCITNTTNGEMGVKPQKVHDL